MQKALATAISLIILPSLFPQKVSSVDTLKPEQKLNSSATLVSANRNFTLGFFSPEDSNKSYLGIWYTNKGEYSPVWLANRNSPIYNDSGVLTLDNSGKLMIMHNGADSIELYAAESGTTITATLLDSGNFIVTEINSTRGKVLWQSFDYPTDTLIPGMKLGINHKTGRNWTLTSWFSPSNPASGAFALEWDPIRRRLVVRRRGVVYWTSGDLKFYQHNNWKLYAFDYIVPKPNVSNLNYVFRNVTTEDEEYFAYSLFQDPVFTPEDRKTLSAWRLDYQGNIFDGGRPSIARVELCYGYNTGGSDGYLGCELWPQPKCRNSHRNFSLRYGYFDTARMFYDNSSTLSQSDCRANCWNDCECAGFMDSKIGCLYWRVKNATFIEDYASTEFKLYALLPDQYPSSSYSSKHKRRKRIIVYVTIVAVFLLVLGSSFFVGLKYKEGKKKKKELQELMKLDCTETFDCENNGVRGHDLKLFSYVSILASTNSFSADNKLGEGGFGPVYKGKLPEGHEIAVKLLSRRSEQGLLEFKTELVLMSKLQHRNLVKLLGFCIHGNDKLIIYDYLPNKSLDFFLFDPAKREQLSWETRFQIIEGIAQGLLYLHKYSRITIIHRDLKASNILLDENMNPKISDFGLARIFKHNVREANTNKRAGTYGYMAPEYVMNGVYSVKSDIYSFGVITLEIVSGQRNNSFHDLGGPPSLVQFAWELWERGAELELMDPELNALSCNVKDQVRKCIQVGLLCVQNQAADRSAIEDVVSMLKNETKSLPMPGRPAFFLRDDAVQKTQKPKFNKFSLNEISLSAMDGR
ncbi:Serine/threonine protein kinase [Handroanthus impetiginosus]|uniref:Receptor-like serine/threonine-protein kinase n=1 Tax=Handroanthus impetiginosus TaxID=429701 RepID=A0A2G9G831_9LAMI|nr:Serine/threonine protein kinase [Handroanthus impetiginosus]